MEIEDCKLIDGWLIVNLNHDPVKNNWQFQFFGKDHSLSEAYELYLSYQPERSKREDLPSWASRAIMMPDGLCHFEDGTVIDSKQPIEKDAVL